MEACDASSGPQPSTIDPETQPSPQPTTYAHYNFVAADNFMIFESRCAGTNDDGMMMGWTDLPIYDCCTYGMIAEACDASSGSEPSTAPEPPTEEPTATCNNDASPGDRYGDGCDKYVSNPNWCGGSYDTWEFQDRNCCACQSHYGL